MIPLHTVVENENWSDTLTNFTKCHFLSQRFTGSQAAFFDFYTQRTKDYKSKRAWTWCKNEGCHALFTRTGDFPEKRAWQP